MMFSTFLLLGQLAEASDNWREKEGRMFSLRYGPSFYDDELLTNIFGEDGNKGLFVDTGMSFYRVIDIGVGFGYLKSEGYLLAADNSVSGVLDTMQVIPLSVSASARLDLWEDQIIVPFGGYGRDYWLWRESWGVETTTTTEVTESTDETDTSTLTESAEKEQVQGGKTGTHTSYGFELLLDRFDVVGASKLKTQFGIEDTYFVMERRSYSIGESGILFDGHSTTFGFRFQY